MPDTSEEYKIILRIDGEEKLRKLAEEVSKEEQALRKLAQQAAATGQSQSAFFAAAEVHAQRIQGLNGKIAETQKQLQSAGVGASRAGQAMQQLGYVVDDVQYGFKGIANNVAPLLTSLGAGAGLAGTVAIVSIGMTQLYEHMDDIQRLMGMGETETEAQRMKKLEEATSRTADETARLNKYKREQAAIEAQRAAVSKAEGQMTNAVNDAVGELGHANAVRGLVNINRARYENSPENTELVQRRDAAAASARSLRLSGQNSAAALAEQRLAGIQAQLDRKVQAQAEADLGKAATDPGRLQGLTNQVVANPGAFGKGGMKFAQQLMAASPETAATEAENRTVAGKDEAKAGSKKDEDREAQKAEADWLKFDQRQQRGRVQARAEQVQESGADAMIRKSMLGVARQGGNADQVLARGTKLYMDQGGLTPEKANEMAREQMKRRLDPTENPVSAYSQKMRESMGAREILSGGASFKDRVMSSGGPGDDPATKQLSELQKSTKSLEQLVQLVQNRTFPAVVN